MIDPTKIRIDTAHRTTLESTLRALRGLYTFTDGNDYITLGAALNTSRLILTSDPSGTPDANTLYKANIPKAGLRFNMATDAIADSFNISSITDGAAGTDTINFDRDFSSANIWGHITTGANVSADFQEFSYLDQHAAGSVRVTVKDDAAGTGVDETAVSVSMYGDQ